MTKDCKLAVAAMPAAREGAEVEWAVNHQAAQYTLPMTLNGDRKGKGRSHLHCQLVYHVVLTESYNHQVTAQCPLKPLDPLPTTTLVPITLRSL